MEDWERPLNARGEKNAPLMARQLAERVVKPDAIVSSHAVRAMMTAKVYAQALGFAEEAIEIDRAAYGAGVDELLDIIRDFDNRQTAMMLVGHNPGLTDLANYLCDALVTDDLPTCGIVVISLPVEHWQAVTASEGTLVDLLSPKRPI